jgi:hypothetical protein
VIHDAIAETISQCLVQISAKAARIMHLTHIIKTKELKKRLAEVYVHVFCFFRDIIQWFLKSRTSRFASSFNDQADKRFKEAASHITKLIDEIDNVAAVGGLAIQRLTLDGISSLHKRSDVAENRIIEQLNQIHAAVLQQPEQQINQAPSQTLLLGNDRARDLLENFDHISLRNQYVEYSISMATFFSICTYLAY